MAGHDLKFFTPLLDYLRLQPDLEVRLDQWAALGKHDADVSRELAGWADVVICEWCGPNAVWYSRHKRRGSRLLVRLHRFELASPYPAQVKIGAVNQVVCVSRHYARLTREQTGWPEAKVVTVPNAIDVAQLDRPKLDGARFHLGLVGIVPSRKRLDLALDVLEELRREDDRYLLFIKSGMPWEHWWVWQNPAEREHYAARCAGCSGPRCCAGRWCSTTRDRTSRPGCAGSASCCPPATTRASTSPRPRGWRPGRCRCCGTGRAPRPSTTCAGSTGTRPRWPPRSRRSATRPTGAGRGDEAHAQAAAAFNLPRRVRGLARPAHHRPRPGACRTEARAARLRLRRHVLHARDQRGHPREVRGAGQRGGRHRSPGHADPRPAARRVAGSGRPDRRPVLARGRTQAAGQAAVARRDHLGGRRRGCTRVPG